MSVGRLTISACWCIQTNGLQSIGNIDVERHKDIFDDDRGYEEIYPTYRDFCE